MALEDKKVPDNIEVSDELAEAIRAGLEEGKLPCETAFALASRRGATPLEMGQAADVLDIHLTGCQLGLFGYPGHAKGWDAAGAAAMPVPVGLEAAIRDSLDDDGVLSCQAAWKLANKFHVPRIQVGYLADRLDVTIRHCQLGAF